MLRFDLMPRTRTHNVHNSNCNTPNVDILENKDSYMLSFEVPGISKDDIKIWIENDLLILSGEKKKNEEEKNTRHYGERRFGKFERSFWLPSDADRNSIKAEFENGVLTVTISKSADAKPKVIEIETK
jgi:HSP20 family protein